MSKRYFTRTYGSILTFLGAEAAENPRVAPDLNSDQFRIIGREGLALFSVLDVSTTKTPDAMNLLEKMYGKEITTRSWNTVNRILRKLETLGV